MQTTLRNCSPFSRMGREDALWGAAMGWHFLDQLLTEVCPGKRFCYVVVKAPPHGLNHQVARDDRRSFIEQYRKIGFRQVLGPTTQLMAQGKGPTPCVHRVSSSCETPVDPELERKLGYVDTSDTLLVLNFAQWKKPQCPRTFYTALT